MSYIMLNHPITYSKTLTNIVRYEVFALILSEFEKDKINISPLLEGRNIEFGSTLYAFFVNRVIENGLKNRNQTVDKKILKICSFQNTNHIFSNSYND